MSLSPICHCQVNPTVGCHQSFEDEGEEGIGVASFMGTESGTGEDEAASSFEYDTQPEKKIKKRRTILYCMMFELRQVILVLGEEFVGHVTDLSQRKHSRCERVVADGAVDGGGIASQ